MNLQDFKRILISFADSENDVSVERGKITAFIRGDAIEAEMEDRDGELYIQESGDVSKARTWIAKRLAQLDQLAERIKDFSPPIADFINPNGTLLDDIDNDPTETERPTEDVTECLREKLGNKIPGTTGVVYLTCDAGEGKTTVINNLAVTQAKLYKQKKTDWLLIPIPLNGRPFLRFDDIVTASLMNTFRYRSLFYDSFIELVRLRLIVPAFDGFEEMFMVNSTGEALSATGQLMSQLNSSGNVLIAARKAYFDYKGFGAQAKLFDTISMDSVAFAKIGINKWNREKFEEYAIQRNIPNGDQIYNIIESRLGAIHPILTRPVLVNQLFTVIAKDGNLDRINSTQLSSTDYFPNFVNAIIIREADTKWVDTSGENKPLLSVDQHYELLSVIAEEMWVNNTESLPINVIDLVSDLYSETNGFSVQISRQIKERIKQHALLTNAQQPNQIKFDHEEFQEFFLGIGIFNALKDNRILEFKNLLRKGTIYGQTVDVLATYCREEKGVNLNDVVNIFQLIQQTENSTSYIKENCGNIVLKMLSTKDGKGIALENYTFPADSLKGISLFNLTLNNSYFQTTGLLATTIHNCIFDSCTFDNIDIIGDHNSIKEVTLRNCEIIAVQNESKDLDFYDPYNIRRELVELGFSFGENVQKEIVTEREIQVDHDLELVQKALRRFIRGSHINDNVFRLKLGQEAEYFIDDLLPMLIHHGIMAEVDYQGAGTKRRFKLNLPFDKINDALKNSDGSFKIFLEKAQKLG